MQETLETQAESLGQEDPLKEGMAPYSNILSGESHGQRSLVQRTFKESDRSVRDNAAHRMETGKRGQSDFPHSLQIVGKKLLLLCSVKEQIPGKYYRARARRSSANSREGTIPYHWEIWASPSPL